MVAWFLDPLAFLETRSARASGAAERQELFEASGRPPCGFQVLQVIRLFDVCSWRLSKQMPRTSPRAAARRSRRLGPAFSLFAPLE